jgi:hypothetical protein
MGQKEVASGVLPVNIMIYLDKSSAVIVRLAILIHPKALRHRVAVIGLTASGENI